MTSVAVIALVCGLAVLVLFAGYCYGRAETEAVMQAEIDEQQRTIDALLPSGLRLHG